MDLKLGRLPGYIPVGLKDLTFYAAGSLPQAPPKVDVPSVPAQSDGTAWGMAGNDTYGDCGVAGIDHLFMADESVTGESGQSPQAADVVNYYLTYTNGQDTGVVLADFLSYVKQQGFFGHSIHAYAPVGVHDIPTLHFAVDAYDAAYTGIAVTSAMQRSYAEGKAWDLDDMLSEVVGGHCLAPGTRILTDSLEWVPIESLQPGDGLTAFEEYPSAGRGKRRKFRKAIVEGTGLLTLPCYELEFSDGTVVRAAYDHLWLVAGAAGDRQWVRTDRMRAGGERATWTYKLFDVWESQDTWKSGYLAAAFDGEGWMDGNENHIRRLGFAQRSNDMLETTGTLLKEAGFNFRQYLHSSKSGYGDNPVYNIALNGRRETVRFLGEMRPQRLLGNFHPDRLGTVNGSPKVRLIRKDYIGEQEVVALQTDTRTYISEGLPSHNCVPIVGYDSEFLYAVTWGKVQPISYSLWHYISSEAWAIISGEFVARGGDGRGVNLAALEADLAKLNT